MASTDEFELTIQRLPSTPIAREAPADLVAAVAAAFDDGEGHTADDVVRRVRRAQPADVSVLARIVTTILLTYACFESADEWTFRYRPELAHAPRRPGPTTSVGAIASRAFRDRAAALNQDRQFRRLRAAGLTSDHMVRGHLRRLTKSTAGSPIQIELARRHGINVPRGKTYVRPHTRRS